MDQRNMEQLVGKSAHFLKALDNKERELNDALKLIEEKKNSPEIPANVSIDEYFTYLHEYGSAINKAIKIVQDKRSELMQNKDLKIFMQVAESLKDII